MHSADALPRSSGHEDLREPLGLQVPKAIKASPERLVELKDHKVREAIKEHKDLKVIRATLVIKERKDLEGIKVHKVHKAQRVVWVHKDQREWRDLRARKEPAQLDHKVQRVVWVHKDQREWRDLRARKEPAQLDHKDQREQQVHKAPQEPLVRKDLKAHREHKDLKALEGLEPTTERPCFQAVAHGRVRPRW
jgi:hypothetical protein